MTSKEALKILLEDLKITTPIKCIQLVEQDLDRLEKLEKIIKDYCYIDNLPNGEVVRMCCEEGEESNYNDFIYLKEIIERK